VKDVAGKVAFITGGASGIGLGMAQVFLRNGMKVMVADLCQEHLDEAKDILSGTKADCRFMKIDVSDRREMARAAEETVEAFGRVHVLCNNAGVSTNAPMEEAGYEDWDWVLGVNLGGVINGIVSFLPKMRAHGEGGHIVNTSSMAGIIPLTSQGGIYCASKFAVRGLSDSLRLALGRYDIGVSVLCPGLTKSQLMSSEKLRPTHLASKAKFETRSQHGISPSNAGMDPVEVGERVLLGIRRNEAYILPHGEFLDEVRGLFDEILAAFPKGQVASPERLAFEAARRKVTAEARSAIKLG
jgi:NAD(P)-dependent dehydrogenase (short-subunit alcohol dehydrogenase family)